MQNYGKIIKKFPRKHPATTAI